MRKLILTAVDNNDKFWYECLVPFLLSLKETNYQGDIGVIEYGLNEAKKITLKQNNILVFPAINKYPEMVLDRQWSTAQIAEQYHYDMIALYDTDIWFPNKTLTLFEQCNESVCLYCSYDIDYNDFIEQSVTDEGKEYIQTQMRSLLAQNGYPWQVGLILGHKDAWKSYQTYMDKQLQGNDFFTMCFGLDSTLINLYAAETDQIRHLPEKYNCIPYWGLKITNLSQKGELVENQFLLNNESVEGIHIVGKIRTYGRHHYEYAHWFDVHYYTQGKKYRFEKVKYQNIEKEKLVDFCHNHIFQNPPNNLFITELEIEGELICKFSNDNLYVQVPCSSKIKLANISHKTIVLNYSVEKAYNYSLCQGIFLQKGNETFVMWQTNSSRTIVIEPNETVALFTYDINTQAKAIWRLENVCLC